jgi:hypothetical protein
MICRCCGASYQPIPITNNPNVCQGCADLELPTDEDYDRLRKAAERIGHEVGGFVDKIQSICRLHRPFNPPKVVAASEIDAEMVRVIEAKRLALKFPIKCRICKAPCDYQFEDICGTCYTAIYEQDIV